MSLRILHSFVVIHGFVVIHTVKGFIRVREAEAGVILELLCFLHENVVNLTSVSYASSKPRILGEEERDSFIALPGEGR